MSCAGFDVRNMSFGLEDTISTGPVREAFCMALSFGIRFALLQLKCVGRWSVLVVFAFHAGRRREQWSFFIYALLKACFSIKA